MKITLHQTGRDNFHNARPITILADVYHDQGRTYATVSSYQLTRVGRHFCGIVGCTCGSGPKIRGRYAGGEAIIDITGWI